MHKFLIDTNIFVQAKNLYYRFDFCSQFWAWIINAHDAGMVFSIERVKKEIEKGNRDDDPINDWIDRLPDSFFLPDDKDPQTLKAYRDIITWASSSTHFKDAAKKEFARGDTADAFLIATAMAHGYEIVTHELPNPDRKNRIMIPDAAAHFGVRTHFVYDVLSEHTSKDFCFRPKAVV